MKTDDGQEERPAHLFKPGQSGNPAGRPKGSGQPNIMALARKHTDKALDLLVKAIDNVELPMNNRIEAAKVVIDRGWGRAPVSIDVNVKLSFDAFLRQMNAKVIEGKATLIDTHCAPGQPPHQLSSDSPSSQASDEADSIDVQCVSSNVAGAVDAVDAVDQLIGASAMRHVGDEVMRVIAEAADEGDEATQPDLFGGSSSGDEAAR